MKFQHQHDQMDCGPSCLSMISSYYGKNYDLQDLREKCFISREGVSLLGISRAAEKIGFKSMAAELSSENFKPEFLPCILYWNQKHFVVLHRIKINPFTKKKTFKIADPGHGFITLSEEKLRKSWFSGADKGVALFLEPTEDFYLYEPQKTSKLSLSYLFKYLSPHKKRLTWIFFLLFLGTIATLALPLLTKILIDDGVSKRDLNVISTVLLAQMAFFLGNLVFGIIRNSIALVMGTKINIEIISDFLKKLFSLPIKFFDTKLRGDFNQRIQDHERIESFLTSQSIITLFSIITFSVFFGILWYFDIRILAVYVALTLLSVLWSLFWMKRRKVLDYLKFDIKSENQDAIYEMIDGVAEMKLNQFEEYKRRNWEDIQKKLFKINIRTLKLDQVQYSGFEFINQAKNIFVTFLAAMFVVYGRMSLGELLSVSYIIGQMNSPVYQLINFFRSLQDAKLSLSRLNEVQNHQEEESEGLISIKNDTSELLLENRSICLENVSFQYEGPDSPFVLSNLNLCIPEGKVTAIVGASGSGKTTLLKLLLKFYNPSNGKIFFGTHNILDISPKSLRKKCGSVMQDGFIFSDSIERNIIGGSVTSDPEMLSNATRIANVDDYIDSMPLGLNTKIGSTGVPMSGGQKQRLLIARAVYKNPHYIFLDEATSALDADNELKIHNNLSHFFRGKTVVIIAHRLSTVKNADQIVVLQKGQIVEKGNHQELVNLKGEYYNLIKNQLELGN